MKSVAVVGTGQKVAALPLQRLGDPRADTIGAFDGQAVKGLTRESAFCGLTSEVGFS